MDATKARKYLDIAYATGRLSKDSSTQVGALVLGPSKEVRSIGYNGAPRGCSADEDERFLTRPEKYFWSSHAEANAITNAARVGTPLEGSTLIVTHPPCMECAKLIVQSGIRTVWSAKPDSEFQERWHEHIIRVHRLFKECDVEYHWL